MQLTGRRKPMPPKTPELRPEHFWELYEQHVDITVTGLRAARALTVRSGKAAYRDALDASMLFRQENPEFVEYVSFYPEIERYLQDFGDPPEHMKGRLDADEILDEETLTLAARERTRKEQQRSDHQKA
jgi:hypothetical protein